MFKKKPTIIQLRKTHALAFEVELFEVKTFLWRTLWDSWIAAPRENEIPAEIGIVTNLQWSYYQSSEMYYTFEYGLFWWFKWQSHMNLVNYYQHNRYSNHWSQCEGPCIWVKGHDKSEITRSFSWFSRNDVNFIRTNRSY